MRLGAAAGRHAADWVLAAAGPRAEKPSFFRMECLIEGGPTGGPVRRLPGCTTDLPILFLPGWMAMTCRFGQKRSGRTLTPKRRVERLQLCPCVHAVAQVSQCNPDGSMW